MLNRAIVAVVAIVGLAVPLHAYSESNFDRQLALDLAAAHIRYVLRGKLGEEHGEANFRKPFFKQATVKGGRMYVFVAYPSVNTASGAFATLQYCEKTGLLVAAEVGIAGSFDANRQSILKIDKNTHVALANACPN